MAEHDVVVIGAGHNGLVSAVVLARSGLDVLVLEAADEPGGCIWTETLESGHRLERGAIDHSMILSIARELHLEQFGLEYVSRETMFAAGFADGRSLVFHQSLDRTIEALSQSAPADIKNYRKLAEIGASLFNMMDSFVEPPRFSDLAQMASVLPSDTDLLRLLVSSSEAVAELHLHDAYLRSAVTMYGSHNQLAPYLPGTGLFALLLAASHGGEVARPMGGSAMLIKALVGALESAGGEIRTNSPVTAITESNTGALVTVDNCDEISARYVISTVDLPRTVALMPSPPSELCQAASKLSSGRFNVGELKIDLALSSQNSLGFGPEADSALWMLQEQTNSLTRSFADIHLGRLPSSPAKMWASPSATDPSAAPDGQGTVWLSAFVPAKPDKGTWDDAFTDQATNWLLDGFASITGQDLRSEALSIQVTTPLDWEERTGNPAGNPNHVDLTIDQLFSWRPPTGLGHRTGLGWLYLSGAGTHPGGGLSGIPGRNAANALLEDLSGSGASLIGRIISESRSLSRIIRLYAALRKA
jgi:beta-carotene ketolase (CrtO type)